jgi:hypothetical protein
MIRNGVMEQRVREKERRARMCASERERESLVKGRKRKIFCASFRFSHGTWVFRVCDMEVCSCDGVYICGYSNCAVPYYACLFSRLQKIEWVENFPVSDCTVACFVE